MRKISQLYSRVLAGILSLAAAIPNIIVGLVLARYLPMTGGTALYARYVLTLSAASICTTIFIGPASNSLTRHSNKDEAFANAYHLLSKLSVLAAACFIGLFLLGSYLGIKLSLFGKDTQWLAVGCCGVIIGSFSSLYEALLYGNGKFSNGAKLSLINNLLKSAVLLSVSMAGKFRISAVMAGLLIAGVLSFLFARLYFSILAKNIEDGFISKTGEKIDQQNLKNDLVKYAIPFILWGPFAWLQSNFDRWMLQTFASHQQVAVYCVAMQVVFTPLQLISSVLEQQIGPQVFRVYDANRQMPWAILSRAFGLYTAVCFVFLFFLKGFRPLLNNILPLMKDPMADRFILFCTFLSFCGAGASFSGFVIQSLKLVMQFTKLKALMILGFSVMSFYFSKKYGQDGLMVAMVFQSLATLLLTVTFAFFHAESHKLKNRLLPQV